MLVLAVLLPTGSSTEATNEVAPSAEDGSVVPLAWERNRESDTVSGGSIGTGVSAGLSLATFPDVVWDSGSIEPRSRQNVPPGNLWASWTQIFSVDVRHFRAAFTFPEGIDPSDNGILYNPYYEQDIVPINDNLYVYVNGVQKFVGGTNYGATNGGFGGSSTVANETDGWYIPSGIQVDGFQPGLNVIDVITEERNSWGGLGYLALRFGDRPPPSHHKVLFIQGISSESQCDDGENENYNRVSWLKDLLISRQAENGLGSGDFLYYGYTSGVNNDPEECDNSPIPEYSSNDACWSLDDKYLLIDRPVTNGGQAYRLAQYLKNYFAKPGNSNVHMTMVGHSQGGVLAAYLASSDLITDEEREKIDAVVTLDSPLGGVPAAGGLLAPEITSCVDDYPDRDSAWDMRTGGPLIDQLGNPPHTSVPLYTVDADPGCFGVTAGGICLIGIEIANDEHSRVEWERGHLQLFAPDHADVWTGWGGDQGRNVERQILANFVHCAIMQKEKPQDCTAGRAIQVPQSAILPEPFEAGSSARARTDTSWDAEGGLGPLQTARNSSTPMTLAQVNSIVTTTLISPTGRVIDADTMAPDVIHFAGPGNESFEVLSPEPGTWTAQLFGLDVPPEGETVVFGVTTVPEPSNDSDADQVGDDIDNCLGVFNPGQYDDDGDGAGDACDDDDDDDGIVDASDNCQFAANPEQEDADANGLGDACDPEGVNDSDADGVVDNLDNCPLDINAGQENTDVDCWGNACDGDDDNDSYNDGIETYLGTDPFDACPDDPTDDAWPPDVNNSGNVNITDIVAFRVKLNYCEGNPGYDPRYDINQQVTGTCSPPAKAVNITDIVLYRTILNTSCTNP
jgi:pimeloyl-ACP methyl ester carboxylesterase